MIYSSPFWNYGLQLWILVENEQKGRIVSWIDASFSKLFGCLVLGTHSQEDEGGMQTSFNLNMKATGDKAS